MQCSAVDSLLLLSATYCRGMSRDRTNNSQNERQVRVRSKLTVVFEVLCFSQALPRLSATFRRLTGSYGCLFLFSTSCPLESIQVVNVPPLTISTGASWNWAGVSGRDDIREDAREVPLVDATEDARDRDGVRDDLLWPSPTFHVLNDACIGDTAGSFLLARLACKLFSGSSQINLIPRSESKNFLSAACMSCNSVSKVGKAYIRASFSAWDPRLGSNCGMPCWSRNTL